MNSENTSDNTQAKALNKTDVMRGYFGLPFEFKVTAPTGEVFELTLEDLLYNTFSKWDEEELKIQQFTGLLDSKKVKIYFGDTLRFADKWEWYRGTWAWKLMGKTGEEREKLQKEYDELPYEERLVENNEDFEWMLSSEIQSYWEVVV